jgi:hypothetical protein
MKTNWAIEPVAKRVWRCRLGNRLVGTMRYVEGVSLG